MHTLCCTRYLLGSIIGAGHPVWAVRGSVQCIPIHLQGPPVGGLLEAGGAVYPEGVGQQSMYRCSFVPKRQIFKNILTLAPARMPTQYKLVYICPLIPTDTHEKKPARRVFYPTEVSLYKWPVCKHTYKLSSIWGKRGTRLQLHSAAEKPLQNRHATQRNIGDGHGRDST